MQHVLVAVAGILIMPHLLTANASAAEPCPIEPIHNRSTECPGRKTAARKIEDALAYYWSFDNENALDSVREVDGQIIGNVLFTDGVLGKATVIQDDSTQIIMQSPNLDLDGWEQITLSMWCKMKGYSTYGRVISWAQGNQTCGLALHVGGDAGYWHAGAFYVFLENGGYLHVRPKTFSKNVKPYPKTDVWYHLVGTYDGKRVRFYVDGKLDGEQVAETPGLRIKDLPNARMVIGRAAPSPKYDHWQDTYFPGLVDEVRIWARALSSDEVRLLYDQTLHKSSGAIPSLGSLTEQQMIALARRYALQSDKCEQFREEISRHFTAPKNEPTSRVVVDLTSHTVTFTRNLIPQDGPKVTITVSMNADGSLLDLDSQVLLPYAAPAWEPVERK